MSWRHFLALSTEPDAALLPFLLRELPRQVARQKAATRAAWVQQAGDWQALAALCARIVVHLRDSRAWPDILAWSDLSDHLATAAGDPGLYLRGWVSVERGDTRKLLGDLTGALAAYRAGMTIHARLAAADPANADWQRDLFVSLVRVTTLLLKAGNRDAACPEAQRLEAQARLLAEHFPQDPQCEDYLHAAADLLALACGPAP